MAPGPPFLSSKEKNHMLDIDTLEDLIANSEPLESFELDEYADQEEISYALQEMLDRELY
jgi:hypothetical protein